MDSEKTLRDIFKGEKISDSDIARFFGSNSSQTIQTIQTILNTRIKDLLYEADPIHSTVKENLQGLRRDGVKMAMSDFNDALKQNFKAMDS